MKNNVNIFVEIIKLQYNQIVKEAGGKYNLDLLKKNMKFFYSKASNSLRIS